MTKRQKAFSFLSPIFAPSHFLALLPSLPQNFKIKLLHFSPCPGGFAQERKARFYAWFTDKTVNPNTTAKLFPTKMIDQVKKDHLKRNTM